MVWRMSSGILDPDTRVSLILGGFDGSFQVPNNPGQTPLGFAVNGVSTFNSADSERIAERGDFVRRAIVAETWRSG